MFDIFASSALTAAVAFVVATYCFLFGKSVKERIAICFFMTAWLAIVLWLGSFEILRPDKFFYGLGLAIVVALPTLVILSVLLGTQSGRARIKNASLPAMIGIHSVRVLGIFFLVLYAAERLPSPFAPIAGWGDILAGAIALPVAFAALHLSTIKSKTVLAWNFFGAADLIAAVVSGLLSLPSPIQVFTMQPDSSLMTSLPWILIPGFLVVTLFSLHVVTHYKVKYN